MNSVTPIEVNLNNIDTIKEQVDVAIEFGQKMTEILKSLLGYSDRPVFIKGKKNQVKAIVNVLAKEKDFLQSKKERGEEHPSTERNKNLLDIEIENFERIMGIDWPIKE